jgi:hypothetical protein
MFTKGSLRLRLFGEHPSTVSAAADPNDPEFAGLSIRDAVADDVLYERKQNHPLYDTRPLARSSARPNDCLTDA